MIIQLEIEQMVKELSKHDSDKARDYIAVLNRTLLEIREGDERLRQSMILTSNEQLSNLEQIIFNRQIVNEIEVLREENENLKKNIA